MSRSLVGIAAFVVLLSFVVWMKVSVWRECRADHGFWYCAHLIDNYGKK